MNKSSLRAKSLTALVLIMLITSLAFSSLEEVNAAGGSLYIHSWSGVNIYVDGGLAGTTDTNGNKQIDGITEGPHSVRLSKTGYKDWIKSFIITNTRVTHIYAYIEEGGGNAVTRNEVILYNSSLGSLYVHAWSGVNVYVDGEFGGATDGNGNRQTDGLLDGTYSVRLTKAGYKDWTKSVRITGGQVNHVYAYLEEGSGVAVTRSEIISYNSLKGSVYVHSSGGVNVFVDGEFGGATDGNGNRQTDGILEGTYTLKLTKTGSMDWIKQVRITSGQVTHIWAYLEDGSGTSVTRNETVSHNSLKGSLYIRSASGVSVYIANEFGGATDGNGNRQTDGILEGTYEVRLTKSGYSTWVKQAKITSGQTTEVWAYLQDGSGVATTRSETIAYNSLRGSLYVRSANDADVFVDGEFGGTTDGNGNRQTDGLLEGTYAVKVTKANCKEWTKQVRISSGHTTEIWVYLEGGSGSAVTRSETIEYNSPRGSLQVHAVGGASVYVSGEYGGSADDGGNRRVDGLLEGTYQLTIKKDNYKDWAGEITITSGKTTEVTAEMEPIATVTPTPTETVTPTPTENPTETSTPTEEPLTPTPTETPTNAQVPTATPRLASQAYTNTKYGFSITPPYGWTISNDTSDEALFICPDVQAAGISVAFINTFAEKTSANLMDYTASSIRYLQEESANFNKLSQDTQIVSGITCNLVTFTLTDQGYEFKGKLAFFVENGNAFVTGFEALSSYYETYLPMFEQSLQTFNINQVNQISAQFPVEIIIIVVIVVIVIAAIIIIVAASRKKLKPSVAPSTITASVPPPNYPPTTSQLRAQSQAQVAPSPMQTASASKICTKCGASNEAKMKFCTACGKPFVDTNASDNKPANTQSPPSMRPVERRTIVEELEGISPKDLQSPAESSDDKKWVQAGAQEFYSIEASKDLEPFINKYTPNQLQAIIGAIDLYGMATYHNPWGTGSYHRTKVLELSRWLKQKERWQDADACHQKLLEMLKWSNDKITPSDFLMLEDFGKDLMNFLFKVDKPVLGADGPDRKMNEALQVFDKASSHAQPGSSGYIDTMAWKGACYLNLGNKEKAKETFTLVLKYDPNHKMAIEVLGHLGKQ